MIDLTAMPVLCTGGPASAVIGSRLRRAFHAQQPLPQAFATALTPYAYLITYEAQLCNRTNTAVPVFAAI
jgi:hypothetical protein